MYDVDLGRFVGRDPLGYVDGFGLQTAYFVPLGVDPFGLNGPGVQAPPAPPPPTPKPTVPGGGSTTFNEPSPNSWRGPTQTTGNSPSRTVSATGPAGVVGGVAIADALLRSMYPDYGVEKRLGFSPSNVQGIAWVQMRDYWERQGRIMDQSKAEAEAQARADAEAKAQAEVEAKNAAAAKAKIEAELDEVRRKRAAEREKLVASRASAPEDEEVPKTAAAVQKSMTDRMVESLNWIHKRT